MRIAVDLPAPFGPRNRSRYELRVSGGTRLMPYLCGGFPQGPPSVGEAGREFGYPVGAVLWAHPARAL